MPGIFAPLLARERAANAIEVLRATPMQPWHLVSAGARLIVTGLLILAGSRSCRSSWCSVA